MLIKPAISLYIALCLFGLSCKKTSEPGIDQTRENAGFEGTWELRVLIGCQIPNCNPYYEEGNGTRWVFTDSTYEFYRDHILISADELVKGKDTLVDGTAIDYFFLLTQDPWKLQYEIKQDTLSVQWGHPAGDGFIEKFVQL